MRLSVIVTILAGLAGVLGSTGAGAFLIEPFRPGGASVVLTGTDIRIMRQQTLALLDRGSLGEIREWSNKSSGNSGTMRLITIFKPNGAACRRVRHVVKFKGLKDTQSFVVRYCQVNGVWRNAAQ
jgi:surface antigen